MKTSNYISEKMRPAIPYIGGKSIIARKILPFFQDHYIYLEPFAGGLNVLLNKHRARREIANDLCTDLIGFYQFLVRDVDSLVNVVRKIEYSKESFLSARDAQGVTDPLQRAVNFYVKHHLSRNGQGDCFFLPLTDQDKHFRAWESHPFSLYKAAQRLAKVEFHNRDAFELIQETDDFGVQVYCDPPYYSSTRTGMGQYEHELTDFDHIKLLRLLKSCRAHVIVSGYPSGLYEEELQGWHRETFSMTSRCSTSSGSNTREGNLPIQSHEVIWVKPHQVF